MAENLDCSASNLLCTENTSSRFDGDRDFNAINEFGFSPDCHHHLKNQIFNQRHRFLINNKSTSLMGSSGFAIQSDDRIKEMIEKEIEHSPRDDYLKRLRSGDLDLSVRKEALDWIWKTCAYYQFGPLSLCLSINYLDRFLSVYELPRGKTWTVQLLAVACLSIAAKMEETKVPPSVDLQVIRTCRFGLMCLAIDVIQFPDCVGFVLDLGGGTKTDPMNAGIDFLEFRPSEIAAAVAISVSGGKQTFALDKAIPRFISVEKGRVLKCVEVMKDFSLIKGPAKVNADVGRLSASSAVPQSPIGVLDAATCLSCKSDEIKVVPCANSSHSSTPDIKKRKLDHHHHHNN
ncbi:hypothetical protein Gorai_019378 [Gossypium raimondii]|uniref:Cyclin-like domain-containing protein n=1 Tax=Gossypium raimondii TaxID=29730 RepID=A0A7J8PP85_GOSRA|nr:hypothetical protein [Gossypium raimondii]